MHVMTAHIVTDFTVGCLSFTHRNFVWFEFDLQRNERWLPEENNYESTRKVLYAHHRASTDDNNFDVKTLSSL